MGLDRPCSGGYLACLLAALSGKAGVLFCQADTFLANDDKEEIAPVIDLNHFAGMHILRDEYAIEDGDRSSRTPDILLNGTNLTLTSPTSPGFLCLCFGGSNHLFSKRSKQVGVIFVLVQWEHPGVLLDVVVHAPRLISNLQKWLNGY